MEIKILYRSIQKNVPMIRDAQNATFGALFHQVGLI